jgi:hypothetical protein
VNALPGAPLSLPEKENLINYEVRSSEIVTIENVKKSQNVQGGCNSVGGTTAWSKVRLEVEKLAWATQ